MRVWIVLFVALADVFAMQISNASDQERKVQFFWSGSAAGPDCRKGTVEERLECLTAEMIQLKQRMDGREAHIVPLQR